MSNGKIVTQHGYTTLLLSSRNGGVCNNDVSPSKPCSQGRGEIDALHANNSCVVRCGGSRCKTCKHLVVGNSFASNVTRKSYNISCPRGSISCGTKNVIYVISCI